MSELANELLALCADECRNRIDYRCAVCRGADAVQRLTEAEAAAEWRDAILGLVATWPEYESLPWGGDKSGWGFVFEMLKLVHKRLTAAEARLRKHEPEYVVERRVIGEDGVVRMLPGDEREDE